MSEISEHVTPLRGYDLWAQQYDGYDNPLIALEQPIVRDLIGPASGLDVADIGCGTGRYALPLAAAGARVVGVDFSLGMLDVLRGKDPPGSLRLVEHDLTAGIPLESDAFDLVLCCLVIEHIPEIDGMLRELARLCRQGGRLIISDLHPELIRRGFQARFHKTPTEKVQIDGAYRPVADYVMAAVRAGLRIDRISEHLMDRETAERSPSATKWVDLPLLLLLSLLK